MMDSTSLTGSALAPASLPSEQDPDGIPAGEVLTPASEEKSEPVRFEANTGAQSLAISPDETKSSKEPVKTRQKSLSAARLLTTATRLLIALAIAFTVL